MTIEELIPKIMEHASEYAVESEEQIFVGMDQNDKTKPIYEKKHVRKLDVDIYTIIQFCLDYNLPLPIEILQNGDKNESENL